MNNLIVAIITISLGAAMVGASVYYGGTGYMANESTASADKYINYLSQVANVVNLWGQRNGGTFPRPSTDYPSPGCVNTAYCTVTELQTMLGTRYISIPGTPDGADASQLYYWNEASSAMQNPVLILRLGTGPVTKSICTAIETIRQKTTPSQLRVYNGTNAGYDGGAKNINRTMCGNFGCFQNDGTFGAVGTSLYVVYARVGGKPNTSLTDYPSAGAACPIY